MDTKEKDQWTLSTYLQDDFLEVWIDAFLVDRQAQGMSKGTIYFYKWKLGDFSKFCISKAVKNITQITPSLLRDYLLLLENQGHNQGGIHGFYRSVKCFLRWWENEAEPENWTNPIKKVKPPKVPEEILEPVSIEVVYKMMEVCSNNMNGMRDKSIMLFLLDTGIRASELCSLNIEDVNPIQGDVKILLGKGKKPRTVYLGSKSRKALRNYIRLREDNNQALWITNQGERLTYRGLKMVMRRRAEKAGVRVPQVHSFRRWFALTMLRNGADVFSLQRLLGHSDLTVLRRYLHQTETDMRESHHRANPVDNI